MTGSQLVAWSYREGGYWPVRLRQAKLGANVAGGSATATRTQGPFGKSSRGPACNMVHCSICMRTVTLRKRAAHL